MLSNAVITPLDGLLNHKCAIVLSPSVEADNNNDDTESISTSASTMQVDSDRSSTKQTQRFTQSKKPKAPSPHSVNNIVLICDTELQRTKWIEALRNAAKM